MHRADQVDPADNLPYDMVKDWITYDPDGDPNNTPRIDHPLNEDNVYSNPEIVAKITNAGT